MVIFFWLITLIVFVLTSVILIRYFLQDPKNREAFRTVLDGFKEGLRGCGFKFQKSKYTIELYKWVTLENDEVCEDCLQRASWEPMDIADWMKEGLPKTSEADTQCKARCRCKLMLVKSKVQTHKHHENSNNSP